MTYMPTTFEEDPSMRKALDDVIHDLRITQAMVDVIIDAQDNTSLDAVMLSLEHISVRLSQAQTFLLEAIAEDE